MKMPITLITGTGKGIGKFLAEHYLAQGHQVIGCSRSEADWHLEGYEHHIADVSDEIQVKKIFSAIRKQHGKLDHLISNAGIASMNHFLLTPVSTVHKIMNTNFVGTFLFCREAAKLMKKQQYGRIVNFSTVAVPLRLEGEAIYAASKAAVLSFTQIVSKELADFGITVNAIGPTPVETDLIAAVPKEKIQNLLNQQAIPRFAKFEDIANVTDFFLRKESAFITGQALFLGGI